MLFVALILVLGSVLAVWALAHGRRQRLTEWTEVRDRTIPVHEDALRNLLDGNETAYLQRALAPAAFRRVQRRRLLAALTYLRALSHNAAIMIQLGELGRNSADAAVQGASVQLLNAALLLRLQATLGMVRLSAQCVWPGATDHETSLLSTYDRLRSDFHAVLRARAPMAAGALYSCL